MGKGRRKQRRKRRSGVEGIMQTSKSYFALSDLSKENFLGSGEFSDAYLVDEHTVVKRNKDVSKFNPQLWNKKQSLERSQRQMEGEVETYKRLSSDGYFIIPEFMYGYEKNGRYYIVREHGEIDLKEGEENRFMPKWKEGSVKQEDYDRFTVELYRMAVQDGHFEDILQVAKREDGSLFLMDLGLFIRKDVRSREEGMISVEDPDSLYAKTDRYHQLSFRLDHLDEQLGLKHKDPPYVYDDNIEYWEGRIGALIGQDYVKKQIDYWKEEKKKAYPVYPDIEREREHSVLYRADDWFFLKHIWKGNNMKTDYSPFSSPFTTSEDVAKEFFDKKEWVDQDSESVEELKGFALIIEVEKDSLVDNQIISIEHLRKEDYIAHPEFIDHVWQEGEFADPFIQDHEDYFYYELREFDVLLGDNLDEWGEYENASEKDKKETLKIVKQFREWKIDRMEEIGEIDDYEFMDEWEGYSPRLMRIDKAMSIALNEYEYITLESPNIDDVMFIHVQSKAQRDVIVKEFPEFKDRIKIDLS